MHFLEGNQPGSKDLKGYTPSLAFFFPEDNHSNKCGPDDSLGFF